MKTHNRLLITFISFLGISFPISAAELPTLHVTPVTVYAHKTASPYNEIPSNMTVITSADIRELPGKTVDEVISSVTGVNISTTGGTGRGAIGMIQGSELHQTTVLLDGIPFNQLSSGAANLAQFQLSAIEQIDIIKGPASSVWGSALGGVINIVTASGDHSGTQLIGEAGGYGTYRIGATVADHAPGFHFFLSGTHLSSTGFRDKSAIFSQQLYSKMGFSLAPDHQINLTLGRHYSDNEEFSMPPYWQARNSLTNFGSLGWTITPSDQTNVAIRVRHLKNILTNETYALTNDLLLGSLTSTDNIMGIDATIDHHFSPHTVLLMGVDYQESTLSSPYLTTDETTYNTAFFSTLRFPIAGSIIGTTGLRYDGNNAFGHQWSPSVGLVSPFTIGVPSILRISVERGFTSPPILWRYMETARSAANPDLTAEHPTSIQTNLETHLLPTLTTKAVLYYSDITDAIDRATNDDNKTYMKNYQSYVRKGVELHTIWHAIPALSIHLAGGFNDVRDTTTNLVVTGRARYTAHIGIRHALPMGVITRLDGNYICWNEETKYNPNDEKFVWNLNTSYTLTDHYSVYMTINNLFDVDYWQYADYPMPGRYVLCGMRCTL